MTGPELPRPRAPKRVIRDLERAIKNLRDHDLGDARLYVDTWVLHDLERTLRWARGEEHGR